jgi:hypothetical protein
MIMRRSGSICRSLYAALVGVILMVLNSGAPSLASSELATGYEQIEVHNGGTITGKVTLKGPIPKPRIFHLSLYPFGTFCKKISDGKGNLVLQEYNVGPDGGFQDTIIAVEHVRKGKPFVPIKAEYVSTNCMFHPAEIPESELYHTDQMGHMKHVHPLVEVMENHEPLTVVNKDPIFHNGQVFERERGNIVMNFPLPPGNDKPQGGILELDHGKRLVEMICGMHEFMQAWGFAVDNPYYAKTKIDGKFSIGQLPPGTYEVVAWHPHFKPIEKKITVPADGSVSLDFEFDASTVHRRTFESEEGTRAF